MNHENTDCKRKPCNESGQVKCMDCCKNDTCQEPKDAEYVEWKLFRTGK